MVQRSERITPPNVNRPPTRWYIANCSCSTTAAISAVINGSRLKNSVVRLGPRRTTACIHASGATIEASRQA
ncbi:hypothetical protein D3C79_1020260 [compost metagenome]